MNRLDWQVTAVSDDDRKKLLEAVARTLDQAADTHRPHACDVEPWLRAIGGAIRRLAADGTPASGPAQVATEAYRDGWHRIFGGKHDRSLN